MCCFIHTYISFCLPLVFTRGISFRNRTLTSLLDFIRCFPLKQYAVIDIPNGASCFWIDIKSLFVDTLYMYPIRYSATVREVPIGVCGISFCPRWTEWSTVYSVWNKLPLIYGLFCVWENWIYVPYFHNDHYLVIIFFIGDSGVLIWFLRNLCSFFIFYSWDFMP